MYNALRVRPVTNVPQVDPPCVYVFICMCVCIFIKLHITAQSGPVILVILCHSRGSSQGGIDDDYYENL